MKLPKVKTPIQIRFSDLDILGHVSNSIYNQYFEIGRLAWKDAMGGEDHSYVIATMTIDFLREINLKDTIYVTTSCIKKGVKSATLLQEIYSNEELVTKATFVIVGFDTKTRQSCALLEGWQES
jgi:acyl-CoA thioester hydrolase